MYYWILIKEVSFGFKEYGVFSRNVYLWERNFGHSFVGFFFLLLDGGRSVYRQSIDIIVD